MSREGWYHINMFNADIYMSRDDWNHISRFSHEGLCQERVGITLAGLTMKDYVKRGLESH